MKRSNIRKERRSGQRKEEEVGGVQEEIKKLIVRGSNVLKPSFRPLSEPFSPRSNTLLRRGWHPIRKVDNPRENASNAVQIGQMETETATRYRLRKQTCNQRLAGRGAGWYLITPEIPSNCSGNLRRVRDEIPRFTSPSAVLAIPTSETIYSRAIAKPKELHLISRETVCFSVKQFRRINFDFQARCRSEIRKSLRKDNITLI